MHGRSFDSSRRRSPHNKRQRNQKRNCQRQNGYHVLIGERRCLLLQQKSDPSVSLAHRLRWAEPLALQRGGKTADHSPELRVDADSLTEGYVQRLLGIFFDAVVIRDTAKHP